MSAPLWRPTTASLHEMPLRNCLAALGRQGRTASVKLTPRVLRLRSRAPELLLQPCDMLGKTRSTAKPQRSSAAFERLAKLDDTA